MMSVVTQLSSMFNITTAILGRIVRHVYFKNKLLIIFVILGKNIFYKNIKI